MTDLAALQARCRVAIDVGELYEAARQQQMVFGRSFQWLEAVWQGDGDALGRLRMPETVDDVEGYRSHPGLLDACMQLTSTMIADDGLWLPVAIHALHVYQEPSGQTFWCHAQQVGERLWDLQLLDAMGAALADFNGL